MAFEKGNTYGKGRVKGSKNRKTIIKESLNKLKEIGINPLRVSKELIDTLTANTEMSNKEKISLLGLMTSLFKYELLERKDEIKLDELLEENEVLAKENEDLKLNFIGTPAELLESLKNSVEDDKNGN